jgi:hypothetical protein
MRSPAFLCAVACLSAGCAVPEVDFYPDDARQDVTTSGDVQSTADGPGATDGDGTLDASADAAPDVPYDGPAYCTTDGPTAPQGTSCCADSSVLCSGGCNAKACAACAGCELPNICCSQGAKGTCKAQCQ